MDTKKCPVKMGNPSLTPEQWSCEEAACAWWQEPHDYSAAYQISLAPRIDPGYCTAAHQKCTSIIKR